LIARLYFEQDYAVVSLDNYPSDKVGEILNGFSVDRKYNQAPSDTSPASNWNWRIDQDFIPALIFVFRYLQITLLPEAPND